MSQSNYLITTPDYYPQIGGLSTFCLNIEKSLKDRNVKYDLFHWKKPADFKKIKKTNCDKIINIHPWASFYYESFCERKTPFINFYHGSEVLFKGSNVFKTLIKKGFKKRVVKNFEKAEHNIFISEFTFDKVLKQGLNANYARDLIYHNVISLEHSSFVDLNIKRKISFIAVGRDVPHKNLNGCVYFCEKIKELFPHFDIVLYITAKKSSPSIKIVDISGVDNNKLEYYFQKAHFNLLFSRDNSHLGYYEGFGLTCLEAGKYGVPSIVTASGGLPENVHHGYNGLIVDPLDFSANALEIFNDPEGYFQMRRQTYEHTHRSHGLKQLNDLWRMIA